MGCTNELIPLPNKKHQQNIHILVFRHSLKSILAVIFEWSCCDNFWYFPYQHSGEQSNIVNMILVFQRKILYLIMKLKMCSTLQMFAGNCRDSTGKSECRYFKFMGIACTGWTIKDVPPGSSQEAPISGASCTVGKMIGFSGFQIGKVIGDGGSLHIHNN